MPKEPVNLAKKLAEMLGERPRFNRPEEAKLETAAVTVELDKSDDDEWEDVGEEEEVLESDTVVDPDQQKKEETKKRSTPMEKHRQLLEKVDLDID